MLPFAAVWPRAPPWFGVRADLCLYSPARARLLESAADSLVALFHDILYRGCRFLSGETSPAALSSETPAEKTIQMQSRTERSSYSTRTRIKARN